VTWENVAGFHTVTECDPTFETCPPTGGFDSGQMTVGETFAHTFNSAGTFPYYCAFHPTQMRGRILVQEQPTAAPTEPPATAAPTAAPGQTTGAVGQATQAPTSRPTSTAAAGAASEAVGGGGVPSTGGPPGAEQSALPAVLATLAGLALMAAGGATVALAASGRGR
jgi:hypothetical protein